MGRRKRVDILQVKVDVLDLLKACRQVIKWFDQDEAKLVCTVNPEMIMLANKDEQLLKIINQAEMVTADGIGVVIAGKILRRPLPERVAGYDLQLALFEEMAKSGKTVFLLGAAPGVAEMAKKRLQQRFSGLQISGTFHGYFDDDQPVVDLIKKAQPDLLLVALGAKKQEIFMQQHRSVLGAKVMIGVGGSLDGFAGKVKRAPDFWIRCHLEWLYRLIKQPSRLGRMLQLPLFVLRVIGQRFRMSREK